MQRNTQFCSTVAASIIFLFFSPAVGAQVYEIEDCDFERGLALYSFSASGIDKKAISEVCVDREGGHVAAIENISGFEIVRRTGDAERFERLSESGEPSKKTSMEIAPSITTWSSYDETSIVSPELSIRTNYLGGPKITKYKTDSYSARGYLYEFLAENTSKRRMIPFYIAAFYYRETESEWDGYTQKIPPIVLTGTLALENGQGEVSVNENTDFAPNMGPSDGQYTFEISETGELTFDGTFTTQNSRLAGFSKDEWKSASCNVNSAKGHILGKDGHLMRAIGLGKCRMIDINGKEGEISMQYFIEGFEPK
ncbi:MAG: hypothetical protein RDA78_02955 [Roseibium sp.]|uniref:hypothetical protein n=1 Tax=Roseibium sp. TaxID=1936156 RepID=UPI003D9C2F5B